MSTNIYTCARCTGVIEGAAEIVFGHVVHSRCAVAFRAHELGLDFRCPECDGRGKVVDKDHPTQWRDDDSSGYDGWCAPPRMVPTAWEQKRCALCNGFGFLDEKPVEITQHVGWKRP